MTALSNSAALRGQDSRQIEGNLDATLTSDFSMDYLRSLGYAEQLWRW
jgi:hypothetical protein